jgi:autotransporter-associated beta strand protein
MRARPRRHRTILRVSACAFAGFLGTLNSSAQTQPPSANDRVTGLDISAWQGNWTTTQWATIHRPTNQTNSNGVFGDGRDFVFIRSSRGGTTGYYDQSDSDNSNNLNTLSQRYDDPYFCQNITRATAAGMLAGPYHFGRMDIISTTKNADGIPNTGTDEADHFVQMAGPWMRPGYLLPVFDFEAGNGFRTASELAQFAIDFSNRIYAVKGIRPQVYIGNNYASPMNNIVESPAIVAAMPNLWTARWPNQTDPNSIAIQNTDPGDYTSTVYGPWDNAPGSADPWSFWQYASTAHLNAYSGNLDVDVAHGNIEFVKDRLVPAFWTQTTGGNWGTVTNWNSGETPTAPVQGPGQVARVGTLVLPTPRAPGRPGENNITGADDSVILDRSSESITVTIDSTTPAVSIRRLTLNERLNVSGSTLGVRLTGIVGSGGMLSVSGGTTTIDQATFNAGSALDFAGAGTFTVGSLILNADVTYTGMAGMGLLNGKTGAPAINLGGATRSFTIADGSAATDLRVALPISNGNLTKEGLGTLELTGNNAGFTGIVTINNGYLLLSANNQLGASGVTTGQTTTTGGTVRLSGSNLVYNVPLTIGGAGNSVTLSTAGALENVSGNNTWSGPITLAGDQGNINQPKLNQIYAAAGTTLTLSGVISNPQSIAATWAKTGDGDVVLTGASPNTYTNLTRVFGGRLIIEKDGALGSAGGNSATGNTFMLGSAANTIAFRAPAGSSGLNYNTVEWIHTDSTGVTGFGQIDNLGGNNVFAGHIGLGGSSAGGTLKNSSIGVTAGSLEIKGGLYARSTTGSEPRNIAKSGPGTLILSGDSGVAPANTQDAFLASGTAFNINDGTVLLKGTAGATANVPAVSLWNVNSATARLSLDKTNATGSASVFLYGGTLHTAATTGGPVEVAGQFLLPATGTGGTIDVGAGATLSLTGSVSNSGKTLTKTGAGTLNFSTLPGGHSAGSAFVASAGTTNLNADAGLPTSFALNVNVGAATVNMNASQHLANVSIASGGLVTLAPGKTTMLRMTGLSIANGGVLETNDDDIVVDYAVGQTSPYTAMCGYAVNAFINPTGGVMRTGSMLSPNRIVAVIENATAGYTDWGGESIDATSVIGKYLIFGDRNMDGTVSPSDYNWTLPIPEPGVGTAGWRGGDFTYDGVVNYLDYAASDANLSLGSARDQLIAQHTGLYGQPYLDALAQAEAGNYAYLLSGEAIPEPATVVLMSVAFTAAVVARRRRVVTC